MAALVTAQRTAAAAIAAELERDRNRARSRRKPQPLRSKPVTVGDLIRDGKLLEVECSACKPSRHLYIEPLSLGLPKRLPCRMWPTISSAASVVPGMTNSTADTRAAGCESSRGDRQISAMVTRARPQ